MILPLLLQSFQIIAVAVSYRRQHFFDEILLAILLYSSAIAAAYSLERAKRRALERQPAAAGARRRTYADGYALMLIEMRRTRTPAHMGRWPAESSFHVPIRREICCDTPMFLGIGGRVAVYGGRYVMRAAPRNISHYCIFAARRGHGAAF